MQEQLPLPKEVLDQHIIALGKTGAGKSSKMRLIVESLLNDEKPVCILDPKGDWFGLKSSSDGKSAGFPVVIFGGEHADVPINAHSGAAVAELVGTGNRPTLIDLGGWTVADRTRFFIDFAASLFKTTRGMRHLVIDEVHNFAPQGKIMSPEAGFMLHWANRLASEGRGKGLTIIAASQRPQKVNKDFLTSCETLIACKVIHKLDRESIKDWIDGCADAMLGKQVISELAQLKKPQAWVWCPEIEFGPKCITFPMFSTFDSFKPRHADAVDLKGWASVDLAEVKSKLAAVVQEAEANNPALLKKRIAQLERDIRFSTSEFDKKSLADEYKRGYWEGHAIGHRSGTEAGMQLGLCSAFTQIEALAERMTKELPPIIGVDHGSPEGDRTAVAVRRGNEIVTSMVAPKLTELPENIRVTQKTSAGSITINPPVIRPDIPLTNPERRVLDACAWVGVMTGNEILNTVFVAMIADYAVNASSFKNPRSSLHKKGLIEYVNGDLKLTEVGAQLASWPENAISHDQLHQRILGRLPDPECRLLQPLLRVYPDPMDAADLARESNYALEASSFKNPRAKLHVLGLIDYLPNKQLRAAAKLFP